MKQKIYNISILWLLCICGTVYSQNSKEDILKHDLSGLFVDSDMTGILGEDCSRIDIHFTEVRKTDDRKYEVKGSSRTRLSVICPFRGNICIDSISPYPQDRDECTELDGFISGHYSFTEFGDERFSGTFSGTFRQGYRISGQQIVKGRNEIAELKLNLSEYRGKWKSEKGLTKRCSWADEIIPDIPADFYRFNDAGEWIVIPKYRKNGWENRYNAYHNETLKAGEIQKAREMEEQEWWMDKNQQ